MPITRFVPAGAEQRDFPDAAVVAYCYDSAQGPAFIAYKGRKGKHSKHLAFRSAEHRDANLERYVEQEATTEQYRRESRARGHGLVVGDVVYSSWGYEQTNVEFFEVLRVPGPRSAVVREIEADKVEDTGLMAGKATAKRGCFVVSAKELTYRASGLHRLAGGRSTRGDLQKWDGTPRRYTTYA